MKRRVGDIADEHARAMGEQPLGDCQADAGGARRHQHPPAR